MKECFEYNLAVFSLSQIMHTEQPTLGERVTKKTFLEYSHKTLIA